MSQPVAPPLLCSGATADTLAWPEPQEPLFAGLSSLRVANLRPTFEALAPLRLPGRAGSSLRGALGWSLIDLEHLVDQEPTLQAMFGAAATQRKRWQDGAPRPFVVSGRGRDLAAGERFELTVTLIGRLVDAAETVLQGIAHAAEAGLGMGKVPCRLIGATLDPLVPRSFSGLTPDADLEMRTCTPVRVKAHGHFCPVLTFPTLVRVGLRRISALMELYGDQGRALQWPFPEMIERARDVQVCTSTMCPVRVARYSQRQEKKIVVEAAQGVVVYSGCWQPFIPLLQIMPALHIGRGTSWGLGSVRFRVLPGS